MVPIGGQQRVCPGPPPAKTASSPQKRVFWDSRGTPSGPPAGTALPRLGTPGRAGSLPRRHPDGGPLFLGRPVDTRAPQPGLPHEDPLLTAVVRLMPQQCGQGLPRGHSWPCIGMDSTSFWSLQCCRMSDTRGPTPARAPPPRRRRPEERLRTRPGGRQAGMASHLGHRGDVCQARRPRVRPPGTTDWARETGPFRSPGHDPWTASGRPVENQRARESGPPEVRPWPPAPSSRGLA